MKDTSKTSLVSDKKSLHKAVAASSKMEGMSFERARKNKDAIKQLKTYGRAFAL